jgi:hypothetical protein
MTGIIPWRGQSRERTIDMSNHTTRDAQLGFEFPVLCKCGCGQEIPPPKFPSWQRQYISGHQPAANRPIAERFWEKVDKRGPDDCWEWQGALDRKGYGQIKLRSYKRGSAHRVSYELHYGECPDDMSVCHICDNPRCVNPAHLFLGTLQDNLRDMRQKGRHVHGDTHPQVKISSAQVRAIRKRYAKEGVSYQELAEEYDTTPRYVSEIICGRKRKNG